MWLKVILAITFSKNFHVMMYYKRRREISREKDYFDTFFANGTKVKKLYNKPRSQLIAYNQNV